ncbi:MAG: OmpA family protein [Deltaproteobacteria bacterium]|jgi:OOP family OmpA-OmpF porin|nr:OmpA family protein [Deltaproteobacteria bacterium]
MKRFSSLIVSLALMLAFAATAMAAPSPGLQAKVSTFDFLIDYSGSMMLKHKELQALKFDLAKTILTRVNDRIPELSYSGSIHYFAPGKEILSQRPYNKGEFGAAVNSLKNTYEVFARRTPMGDGIESWSNKLYGSLERPSAVIIVGDGENNVGFDPLAAAQETLRANPGLCFHVISLADSPAGQATLDSIVALQPSCSVSVKAADLLTSDAAVEQFVYDVFLGRGVVLRSIQFAFDSAALTRESTPILDEVAKLINQSRVEIGGHTCSIGTEEYNQRLSERRADAVKNYLIKKGVPAAKITSRGYGESRPKFDNSTDEGRRLNRRAEIDFR